MLVQCTDLEENMLARTLSSVVSRSSQSIHSRVFKSVCWVCLNAGCVQARKEDRGLTASHIHKSQPPIVNSTTCIFPGERVSSK